MTDLQYDFKKTSTITTKSGIQNLALSHSCELPEVNEIPCFFWGNLVDPYLTARCWITISKVVRSSFGPLPASLRDPIVTAGNERIRFEGFSSCNGVYTRLDMKPQAIDGEFIASGTTNVDFNEPMLNAFNMIQKNERVTLAVGDKEMQVITERTKAIERKVKLPDRWIKGLSSVQLYLSDMELVFKTNKIQTIQIFQTLPKGNVKGDFFLINRLGKYSMSTIDAKPSVRIGGIHRLRLIENLLPLITQMYWYVNSDGQTCSIVCDFENMQLLLALSPDSNRGFSGEGKVFENIQQDIPLEYITGLNHILKSNESFDPTWFSIENEIELTTMDTLTANLSSIGLLGYDLEQKEHFYRRLPFKHDRMLTLNPRLKNAKKILATDDIQFIVNRPEYTEAHVKGTDSTHKVIIQDNLSKCTCQWWTSYQGNRGICKHILAVQISKNNFEK